jgi:hypothetical protein
LTALHPPLVYTRFWSQPQCSLSAWIAVLCLPLAPFFNINVQSCSNDIEIAHNSGDQLAYWGNNHLNLMPLYLAAAADEVVMNEQ